MTANTTLAQKLASTQQKTQHDRLLRNIAATLRRNLEIRDGNDLPCVIGTGYEATNADAIESWVRRNSKIIPGVDDVPALVNELTRRLREALDTHQPQF